MLADEVKISVSSFDFPFFCQQQTAFCPTCGHPLGNRFFNEVGLSSIVLLIGVGSFVYYHLLIRKKKKRLETEEPYKDLSLKIKENYQNYFSASLDLSNKRLQKKKKLFTSTPYCRQLTNLLTPSLCSNDAGDLSEVTNISDLPSNLFATENSLETPKSLIGDGTVAKLDQLLLQIQDIKKSVVEIDADLFEVTGTNAVFDSNLFRIAPAMTPSYSVYSDFSEQLNCLNESQTPSLEWDLNDLTCEVHNSFMFPESQVKDAKRQHISNKPLNLTPLTSLDLTSPSSSATSGKFSISSPEDSQNKNTLQKLIEEAQRLGLLNELIETVKHNKRDSAFCED